jgi:hypothetical protein
MEHHHDNHHDNDEKPNFLETTYYSGGTGVFGLFWTILAISFILSIIIFG